MYPSIEGVLHTPPFISHGDEKEKKTSVDELVNLASKLTKPELKELLARLALSASTADRTDSRDLDMWVVGVQTAMARAIGSSDGAALAPMHLKRNLAAVSSWGAVQDFMTRSKLGEADVMHRQAVYMRLAELVVRVAHSNARAVQAPLTVKLVASRAENIAAIFDTAFPGYLAAGLASIIVRGAVHTGQSLYKDS